MFNHNIEEEKRKNFKDKISVCELKINPLRPRKSSYKIEIYDYDAKLIREDKDSIKKPRKGGGIRKEITKFSKQSAKNLKFHMNNSKIKFSNMITLTYPSEYSNNGTEVKYHLNRFTKFLKSKDCQYTWVIEFQKRGAPHFHLITDKYIDKKEVSEVWFKIVNSGDEKHLQAGTRTEHLRLGRVGAKSYVRKYINKAEQKEVPEEYKNVGRFWGHSDTEYNKEVLEIDQEDTFNIKAKYEMFNRAIRPKEIQDKLNYDWLYEGKKVILWNYRNQVLNELKQ